MIGILLLFQATSGPSATVARAPALGNTSLVLADFDGGMPAGIRGRFIPCHTRPSCAELDSSAGNANTQEQNFLKWIRQTWAQFSALTASGLGWPGPKRDTSQSD